MVKTQARPGLARQRDDVLEVLDARQNSAETRTYGMLGQSLFVGSVDAGDRWHLTTALGQPMRSWDSRDQRFSHGYDALRRPVDRTVSVAGGPEKLLGRVVYGEHLPNPEATNHRGRVYRAYDGAGVAPRSPSTSKATPRQSSVSSSPTKGPARLESVARAKYNPHDGDRGRAPARPRDFLGQQHA